MLRLRSNASLIFMAACIASFALPTHAEVSKPKPGDPVTAIWRTQQFDFDYHAYTSTYSCNGLRAKIDAILRAVGAHQSLRVDMQCSVGTMTRDVRAQITLTTPVEATEENVRAATTYDGRDELVARMRGVAPPTANDVQRFAASWQRIVLSRDRHVGLETSDCDLIRDLREQVFPKLAIQLASSSFSCRSGTATRMSPKVHVLALMPLEPIPVAYRKGKELM